MTINLNLMNQVEILQRLIKIVQHTFIEIHQVMILVIIQKIRIQLKIQKG